VDDHQSVRRGVRALLLLGTIDIEICGEAEDGREAVVKAEKLKPDVVIMDVRMPVLDGFQATREIRQNSPFIQIILLSLHDSPRAREEGRNAGACEFVEKSAIWTKLLPTLRKLQPGSKVSDGASPRVINDGNVEPPPRRITPQVALRDAEQRFLSTFEQTAVGMAHVAENGRWLRVNQKLCEILGFPRSELERLKFQDITHPSDLETDLAQATKVASGELGHYALNSRYIRKDGQIVPIRLNLDAVRDGEGNLRYYTCVIEDTTATAIAEERLRKTQRELQMTTEHLDLLSRQVHAPLTRCSRDLRYLWVNKYYADWLKRPVDKIVGRSILDVLGKEAFHRLEPRFHQVLTGNDVAYRDSVVYNEIGKRIISAAYRPTVDSAGAPDGWMAFVQDITDKCES